MLICVFKGDSLQACVPFLLKVVGRADLLCLLLPLFQFALADFSAIFSEAAREVGTTKWFSPDMSTNGVDMEHTNGTVRLGRTKWSN